MKFKYEHFPSDVWFPTLSIMLVNPQAKKHIPNFKVLVDSGAAGCVFPAMAGEDIGLDVKTGKKMFLRGVTKGVEEQYIHEVAVIIGGHMVELEVGFSYGLRFPLGLLGQKGFFEKFRICFDLPKRDFEIVPKER